MAEEKKLTISPCTLQKNGNLSVDKSQKFEVLLNPANYKRGKSISYNEDVTLGQLGSDQKFYAINSETLDLSIMLDGTGVLHPASSGTEPQDVETQFGELSNIVYNYQGDKHEPNIVRILWGSLIFFGRLTSMTIENNVFINFIGIHPHFRAAFGHDNLGYCLELIFSGNPTGWIGREIEDDELCSGCYQKRQLFGSERKILLF